MPPCTYTKTHFFFFLNYRVFTGYCEFGRPSDHKATKLDLAGVIPNVIFLYLLDRQNISLLDDAGTPLLGAALLHIREGQRQDKTYY